TNIRRGGRQFTINAAYYGVVLAYKSLITFDLPVNAQLTNSKYSDYTYVSEFSKSIVAKINAEGYEALNGWVEFVKSNKDIRVYKNFGLDKFLTSTYVVDEVIDLNTIADSLTTNDRVANIKTAVQARIVNLIYDAWQKTNYGNVLPAGVQPKVVIGTDPRIASQLLEGIHNFLGLPFEVVVSTFWGNSETETEDGQTFIKDKIFISFVANEPGKEISKFSCGYYLFSPGLTLEASYRGELIQGDSMTGDMYKRRVYMARYKFLNILPIIMRFQVKGWEALHSRIPVLIQNVG
ncbi:MAG: hypothetical protein ABGX17_04215, partial [Desulfurobacteriaceae bacterium]